MPDTPGPLHTSYEFYLIHKYAHVMGTRFVKGCYWCDSLAETIARLQQAFREIFDGNGS